MIHPDTKIKPVNEIIGNGVFATNMIPKGTIVVATDQFDVSIPHEEFIHLPEIQRSIMETFTYQDKCGHHILSWDHAKYMNHSCDSNTMITDYNIEIAVRDILRGEEITSEYGLLNGQDSFEIHCGCENCRHYLQEDDLDNYADVWDSLIKESLLLIFSTPQPLWELLDSDTIAGLEALRENPELYSSVRNLKMPNQHC
ncbi:SET domain-containing protein [Candidatus Latescibacterota bacterium]